MTTLYRPVKITSAEQAEALPEGAIVIDDCGDRYTRSGNDGEFWGQADDGTQLSIALAIGNVVTALVPIEAEEEWEDDGRAVWLLSEGEASPADVDDYERRNGRRPSRRLVTPWEEA